MNNSVKTFMVEWMFHNITNNTFLDTERYDEYIKSLCNKCVIDASQSGINVIELEKYAGDLDDYLKEAFENVYDPNAGGIKD